MAPRTEHQAKQAIGGGIIAGLVGGVVMSLFLLLGAFLQGTDVWMVLKGAGTPFLGERAAQPGLDALAVTVGVLCHFAVSIGWGALFGLLFYGLSEPATIAAGVLWGIAVWFGMYYVVLPIVGMGRVASSQPMLRAIVQHVIFGLSVAVAFLPFQRYIPRPVSRQVERPVMP